VGDVESTINGTLHGSEDSVSGGGSNETDIEETFEWASVLDGISSAEVSSISLFLSNEHLVHLLGGQKTSSAQETSAVSSGVVGKSSVESVVSEFM
jgi:hypothetical protein